MNQTVNQTVNREHNRLNQTLKALKDEGRKALVTYIVNGDPTRDATVPTMHEMVAAGANVIELGVPFSDPMAEGPTIQRGHERALMHRVSLRDTLDVVKAFRQTDNTTPIVLMGYANPVERMGYDAFAKAAVEAGVDGLLTVDLPPEEAEPLDDQLKGVGLETIFLISPTTKAERAEKILSLASGFVYYVSLKGVTGAGHLNTDEVEAKMASIRTMTDLPICVGFGIKDGASAKAVAKTADGAVVGSVLVDTMGAMSGEPAQVIAEAVGALVAPIRQALDEL
ncbi:tryptophan synthase subunit alpha [Marinibactrum halimedae]|uniref:Tryptophan synthase alpha chain n=1 Tax=Marinibactrum halimedae TaxID=1444977 RepID=A0AA37T800_9GAMM|nr:tryptophan synthase subunit alpha [Marinibactrum halimedae]MCD9460758.1 tryptophan synthase subunit alpha [Marinibactrum halimedae]GLS26668.1 tryptophan synthase alpha chain [Marinibactrum halimedae]